MMDSSLRRNDANETDALRPGEGGGCNLRDEALTPNVVTILAISGQTFRTMR